MLKIIIKSIILVCIILSIYFIVNPSACSNLVNGRAVNTQEDTPTLPADDTHSELFTPTGDKPLQPAAKPASADSAEQPVPQQTVIGAQQAQPVQTEPGSDAGNTSAAGVIDTNSLQPQAVQAAASAQADKDYAIASRYVALEKQYLAQHADSKNAAKDIAYIVMDDFKLTPAEWEAFLQRATMSNLFEQIRQQQK